MPIYVTKKARNAPLSVDDYEPTFGEYMASAMNDTFNSSPSVLNYSYGKRIEARLGDDAVERLTSAIESNDPGAVADVYDTAPEAMPLEEQQAYLKNEHLEGILTPDAKYTQNELTYLAKLKHEEIEDRLTRERAPGWAAPFGFVGGLGVSMIDPVNLATAYIPAVSSTKALALIGKASSAWGRAGIRAGIGAANGAVGAALVEPWIAAGKLNLELDYSMYDSLANITFGAGMGGVLHPLSGAIGDWKRARKGLRQPWAYVPSTQESERWVAENTDAIYKAFQDSGSDKLTREHAQAAAALYDANLRGMAYDTQTPLGDLYNRYRVKFYGGRDLGLEDTLPEQAGNLVENITEELKASQDIASPSQKKKRRITKAEQDSGNKEGDGNYEYKRLMEQIASGVFEDKPVEQPAAIRQAVETNTAVEPVQERKIAAGKETKLLNGLESDPVRYELRELSELIPSHDPFHGFQKMAGYPDSVQERPYHSDKGEQVKVVRNAMGFNPQYLVNTSPDAINGPPVVTDNGIVLGGNSRVMSLMLVYGKNPAKIERYKEALRQSAHEFGLTSDDVDQFSQPVLVRVSKDIGDAKTMGQKARIYNQTQTQALQAMAEGVGKARLISERTINILAIGTKIFDTLREFLDSRAVKKFVKSLLRDGAIEEKQLSRITDSSGLMLNSEGKALVENILRGMVVPNYDVLNASSASVIAKLDKALVPLARLKLKGGNFDLSGPVTDALQLITDARSGKNGTAVDAYLTQPRLDGKTYKPVTKVLALLFDKATPKEVYTRLNAYAAKALTQPKNLGLLPGLAQLDPAKEFIRAFLLPMANVNKKAIVAFDPVNNFVHKAIQYVYDNGGTTHKGETALEKIRSELARKDISAEQKEFLKNVMTEARKIGGSVDIFDAKAKYAPIYNYEGESFFQQALSDQGSEPRAKVSFGVKGSDAYAVIDFFKSADPSSAPHELYHVFRRIMAEMYDNPGTSEAAKERYRKACEFVGTEPGKAWTPEQEEKFAQAGERFLLEGVSPAPHMNDVLESFQQWMTEIYGAAERSGLEISDEMRKVFSGMLNTADDSRTNFMYALGKILEYDKPEQDFVPDNPLAKQQPQEPSLQEYAANAEQRLDEAYQAVSDRPAVQDTFKQEYDDSMAMADEAIQTAQTRAELMQEAANCIARL